MKRIAIYARFSTDKQNPLSSQDQIDKIKQHLHKEYPNNHVVVGVYHDDGISGKETNRQGLNELLADAENGLFEMVYAEALDRYSRSQWYLPKVYEELENLGIKLFSLSEHEINELHIGLKGTMNALLLKDISDKTKRGQHASILKGIVPRQLVYGYGKDENKVWYPIPEQMEIVRTIFDMYDHGYKLKQIADYIVQQNIAPVGFKKWNVPAIRQIIRRPLYAGVLKWKDTVYDLPQLGILKFSYWQKFQKTKLETGKTKKTRKPFLLLHKTFCSVCGTKMVYSNTPKGYEYYSCTVSQRRHSKHNCSNNYISLPDLEQKVLIHIAKALVSSKATLNTVLNKIHKENSTDPQSTKDIQNTIMVQACKSDFNLTNFKKFIHELETNGTYEPIRINTQKLVKRFNKLARDYLELRTEKDTLLLRMFIKSIHATRTERMNTKAYAYTVELDYPNILEFYLTHIHK